MIVIILTPYSTITDQPGLIKFDKEGVAYSVVQNCCQYAIWIQRNDPMGFPELYTEEKNSEKICVKTACKKWASTVSTKKIALEDKGGQNGTQCMPISMYLLTANQDAMN
jgi:hypothetical protein